MDSFPGGAGFFCRTCLLISFLVGAIPNQLSCIHGVAILAFYSPFFGVVLSPWGLTKDDSPVVEVLFFHAEKQ